jgi:hypothetical protein
MNIKVYDQKALALVGELSVSGLWFDVKKQTFLLNAGSSRTPVESVAPPVEFMVARAEVRIFFHSKKEAEDFIARIHEALGEAERRNAFMLD